MHSRDTDKILVERLLAGDAERYRSLLDRYLAPCWIYAMGMVGDRDLAFATVSEGLTLAFAGIDRIAEVPSRVFPFMLKCVRSQVLAASEAQQQRDTRAGYTNGRELRSDDLTHGFSVLAANGDIRRDDLGLIHQVLRTLPIDAREVWVLHHLAAVDEPHLEYVLEMPAHQRASRLRFAAQHIRRLAGEDVTDGSDTAGAPE